jgi:surfeit locus 1 family protein
MRRVFAAALALLFFSGFVALGTWQVHRRTWKLDLIHKVETRVHAPGRPAPGVAQWASVSAQTHEYRHVDVSGTYLNAAATKVHALTELGSGYWILTPLRVADGSIVLINRGFVPADRPDPSDQPSAVTAADPGSAEPITVTGLLRMTEPGGGFLRPNDAPANRWYSRDVQAIASARGLHSVAPYFIDADASGNSRTDPRIPIGGLTVITFHNNHLLYAITWYTLALMIPGALWLASREAR